MRLRKFLFLASAVLLAFAGIVYAANPATVNVKVTVTATLSVSASAADYTIGSINPSQTTASQAAITITNDSSTAIESFQLSCNASSVPSGWTLANTIGSNQFELLAVFSTTKPAETGGATDYNETGDEDNLTNTTTYSTASKFACAGGVETGVSVATSGTRSLWFRFKAPSSISTGSGTEQSIPVTITAAYPQ